MTGTAYELITPAAATTLLPVAELREHLRISGTDHDARLTTYIEAAVDYWRKLGQWAFLEETWRLTLDDFPRNPDGIVLERAPLKSVTSVKYFDASNVQQTLTADIDYRVDARNIEGWLVPEVNGWPDVYDRINAVEIEFVTGYGATPADVPASARLAIKSTAAWFFWNPEGGDLPGSLDDQMGEYRIFPA